MKDNLGPQGPLNKRLEMKIKILCTRLETYSLLTGDFVKGAHYRKHVRAGNQLMGIGKTPPVGKLWKKL